MMNETLLINVKINAINIAVYSLQPLTTYEFSTQCDGKSYNKEWLVRKTFSKGPGNIMDASKYVEE
jgi:hypothetical protein